MSELKTRFIDDTYAEYFNTGKHELAQIYLKSEADRVIEEKDKELRHANYRRCVAMAAYCDLKMSYWAIREIHEGDTGKFDLYSKWHKRWLQLAEKFKEAK